MSVRDSQKKFGIKSVMDKKLFLELTKKYNVDVMNAMKIIDQLNLQKNNIYKLTETRDSTKQKGGFVITVYDKVIIQGTGQPYEKESRKMSVYANGQPKRLEYYDSFPGLPDRSKTNNEFPAVIEWWPNGSKKQEEWFKNNVKHRDGQPAVISYDESGKPVEQKNYTMGVSGDVLDAGRKQETEFNRKRDDDYRKKQEDLLAKANAKKQNINITNPGLPSNQVPEPLYSINDLNKTQGSVKKPGDSRIDIEFTNPLDFEPQPTSDILNAKSGKKTELETPPKTDSKSTESKPKDKNLYNKIIDSISKALVKKHKEKLTPETLKKIEDYYTSKNRTDKPSPNVNKQYKKEYTGRKRDEFPISRKDESIESLLNTIISEAVELVNKEINLL